MGTNTGGRGLHVHALDLREIVFRPLCLEELNWEETGTGGTGSGLLGDGRCLEISATLVLCSDIHGFCSDLMDASTGVRDGLHVCVLEGSEIPFRPLCLKETGTEGRCLEGTGTAVKDGSARNASVSPGWSSFLGVV